MLVSLRDRWAFRGDPAVPDPTRRDPRLVRWDRIDVAADDQTLRIEFVHGIIDGLHHVEVYEDDEEVRVTVFLGLNHAFRGEGHVLMGLLAWTTAKTNQPSVVGTSTTEPTHKVLKNVSPKMSFSAESNTPRPL
jgi:hypothetical protein